MTTGSVKARLRRQTAIVARWLHIYLSMVSFALILFFAVTGLTLNHPEWLEASQFTKTANGTVPTNLLAPPDKLRIVEYMRNTHHIHGAVGDMNIDDDQITIGFKGPGYSVDVSVQRPAGTYELVETTNGFWGVVNDLHKGRDAGKVWAWVIDISAVLLVIVSLTGLLLIFFLYKKRTTGLTAAAVGAVVILALYRIFIP